MPSSHLLRRQEEVALEYFSQAAAWQSGKLGEAFAGAGHAPNADASADIAAAAAVPRQPPNPKGVAGFGRLVRPELVRDRSWSIVCPDDEAAP